MLLKILGIMAAVVKSSLMRFFASVVIGVVDFVTNITVDVFVNVVKPFLAIWDARFRPVLGQPDPCRRPVSVNYHFLRTCNYSCGFCFHTAKTSYVLPIEEVLSSKY